MLRSLVLGTVLLVGGCSSGTATVESTQPPTTQAETTATSTSVTPTTAEIAPSASTTTDVPAVTTTTVTVPGVTEIDVTVVAGEVAEITATLDEEVRITIRSEVADEVHLHGYDIHADVGPDMPGVLVFVASIPGIFEIEFEGSGNLIAELRVDP